MLRDVERFLKLEKDQSKLFVRALGAVPEKLQGDMKRILVERGNFIAWSINEKSGKYLVHSCV